MAKVLMERDPVAFMRRLDNHERDFRRLLALISPPPRAWRSPTSSPAGGRISRCSSRSGSADRRL